MTKLMSLVVFLLFVSAMNCVHICREDGLFENIEDQGSYYQCTNGKSRLVQCPRVKFFSWYTVFNGKECVDPEFVCPQEIGKYRYVKNNRQYYDCVDSKAILRNCPDNTNFDGFKCAKLEAKSTAQILAMLAQYKLYLDMIRLYYQVQPISMPFTGKEWEGMQRANAERETEHFYEEKRQQNQRDEDTYYANAREEREWYEANY